MPDVQMTWPHLAVHQPRLRSSASPGTSCLILRATLVALCECESRQPEPVGTQRCGHHPVGWCINFILRGCLFLPCLSPIDDLPASRPSIPGKEGSERMMMTSWSGMLAFSLQFDSPSTLESTSATKGRSEQVL